MVVWVSPSLGKVAGVAEAVEYSTGALVVEDIADIV